uniref:Protein YIPF n=1 Tax=Vannella robusta TaxID=1487602 RepID=A0A7S4I628_9EUKA
MENDFFTSTFDQDQDQTQFQAPPVQPSMDRKVNIWTGRFEDESPLLEELGISFSNITQRTVLVLNPIQKEATLDVIQDVDLTGPVIFCLVFGVFLLMAGKVHFGYIYGMGVIACCAMWMLLNLMSRTGIDMGRTASILGYCLLPIVLLAGLGIVFPLNNTIGYIITFGVVLWCSKAASLMFITALQLRDQTILIMYPAGLIYACFALLALF